MQVMMLRYKRFHISYSIAFAAVGILFGLVIGRGIDGLQITPLLLVSLILLLGAFKSNRWWALIAALGAGLLLGAARGSAVEDSYAVYGKYIGQSVQLTGTLSGDPQITSSKQQRFTVSNIRLGEQQLEGEVFVSTYDDKHIKRGDRILFSGKIRQGFAAYGAAINSAKLHKIERQPNFIRDTRERFSEALRLHVAEPMASLGLGFVVGQRSTLPDSLDEQLKIVGLTHIVVASGYNLTILVRFMMRVLSRRSRYLALVCSLAAIILFVLFSGFSPSMNRAVIITTLGLLAWYVGRRFHPAFLILYVAAVTSFYNPMYIWADLGWYLSFFAFAGILIVAPLIIRFFYRRQEPNSFVQLVIETLSAEVMALPLIAFAFSTFPVFGLLANVLVGPFIPAAMALTAITGAMSMIIQPLGAILAFPSTILIAYMVAIVEWLASVPWAQYNFHIGLGHLLVWYSTLFAAIVFVVKKVGYDFRARDRKLEI